MRKYIAKLLGIKPEIEVVEKVVEVPTYKVIELAEPARLSLSEKEFREIVPTLAANPAFVALTQRLNTQYAYLRTQLEQNPKADLHFLQSGIYWCRWLQNQVRMATVKIPERRVDPFDEELQAFKEIDATIERIG